MRPPVLFLTHRIPYPPNKGDKIRSYNILLELNQHYDVHLGCFIDDPNDWDHIHSLETHCASLFCLPLSNKKRYIKALQACFTAKPITLALYQSNRLKRWVEQTVRRHDINKIIIFSGAMAQYVESSAFRSSLRLIDFVDVDSDKWNQYAQKKTGLARWIYQREHRLLENYEHKIAQGFNASLFVSEQEAALFQSTLPETASAAIDFVNNGVDSGYFNPEQVNSHAPISSTSYIVFTGAMDYWANVDAVYWFCHEVWLQLSIRHPELEFIIVGSDPTATVKKLERIQGVRVTGRVDDVRPYIDQAALVIAPLQIARGIQNKVLEAMAMAKPVIATSMAIEGIATHAELAVQVADTPDEFLNACNHALEQSTPEANKANRQWIRQQFSWQQTLKKLPKLLDGIAQEAN